MALLCSCLLGAGRGYLTNQPKNNQKNPSSKQAKTEKKKNVYSEAHSKPFLFWLPMLFSFEYAEIGIEVASNS